MSTPPAPPAAGKSGCLSIKGCLVLLGVVALLIGGTVGYFKLKHWQAARVAARQQAEQAKKFDTAAQHLTDPQASKLPPLVTPKGQAPAPVTVAYDIDQTIRVMHEMDQAMKNKGSFDEYLAYAQQLDPRGVDPEILAERAKVLAVLKKLYLAQKQLDDKGELWLYTADFFMSVLDTFQVNLSPTNFGFGMDKEKAKSSVASLHTRYEKRQALKQAVFDHENELFDVISSYSAKYYTRMEEWDRLCLQRDRAYLAVQEENWPAVESSARGAITQAPYEREAHILLAMALLEQGGEKRQIEAEGLLNAYVQQHPNATAPAYLLLGVLKRQQGRLDEAKLNFEQSAVYYPRQAEALTDLLDPYKQRSYLRKSREGGYVLKQYQSTMLGAGFFSPDLQLAGMNFASKQRDQAESKVFDHFFRRRLQQQWDFVLSDLDFCQQHLGTDFFLIYPEDSYLDLQLEPVRGNRLRVTVNNRSDKELHNVSLIMCLHYTDMIPGDYVALAAGKTLPLLAPHGTTDFGDVSVAQELFGTTKGTNDIVATRAILVAQEAVVWVDTDQYRLAQLTSVRQRRAEGRSVPTLDVPWLTDLKQQPQQALDTLFKDASAAVQVNRFSKDGLNVLLPKALALLKPIFKLKVGDQTLSPSDNQIVGDQIKLHFDKVPDSVKSKDAPMLMQVAGPYADFALQWLKDAEQQYKVKEVKPQP